MKKYTYMSQSPTDTSLETIDKIASSQSTHNWLKEIILSSWFFQKGYLQGAFWACMICLVSVSNDVLMRYLGERLHVAEIIFFRFLFSMITVVPLMMSRGLTLFKTNRPHLHVFRAILGVGAIGACCYAVNVMPLSENTTIMFSQPLFFLPLAVLLLKEKVDAPRWIATLFGFAGLLIIIQPGSETFNLVALIPMAAAFQFALLDILAKKMVATENTYSMLFYFAFGTTIGAFIPAIIFWQTPTLAELGLLILLGIGANLIQVCLIRAFSATDASALMPFRYVELIFSALIGFLLFSEVPMALILEGAALIIAATFYISYYEAKKKNKI
ncbi:DMT family transporter [Candidatus Paracaedibacter symbiosus]|uniref:DMT family transporter n=1 Tax=Candidatus Paracaedibacter symbiosus TaxID=244582 RepID=UPI000A02397D|nr:DMT family transporter [Candidatus Paracaedibacter symbiosus]